VLEVVNDDMPYLLDSTLAELVARGLQAKLVAHPILAVRRGPDGALSGPVAPAGEATPPDTRRESLIHIHLDRIGDEAARADLVSGLGRVYADVAAVARDAADMRAQLAALAAEYRANPPPLDADETAEATAFLDWLQDGRFVLLGMRAYRLPDQEAALEPIPDTGLGLLRAPMSRS
jgi:glutamate dehydrogenase